VHRVSTASVARLVLLSLLFGAPLCAQAARNVRSMDRHIDGTYSDQDLANTKTLTLPRVFLYDGNGALIAQQHWPAELQGFKEHAGDAFCCVSDKPSPPGSSGPPPDCKKIVYGADVRENFKGLIKPSGQPVSYDRLPKHRYLLVEYYASWCQPCVSGRRALEKFFSSGGPSRDYLWVSIDMSRLPEAREAAQRLQRKPRDR
jgi:hypothetical protein